MEARKGLDDRDLNNPRRANPATVGMTMLLIIGVLVLGSALALNFFVGHFSILTFVSGIVLIAVAIVFLMAKAFKKEPAGK